MTFWSQELCEQLIEDPSDPPAKDIPSLDDIDYVERRINTLKQEKSYRLDRFHSLKKDIKDQLSDLNQSPSSRFLLSALSDKEELFTLSLHNLESLKKIKKDLGEKVFGLFVFLKI